ncbi:MAG: hypothetical protein M3198_09120 [Actinomycetota bacterium]|nr:hypothetical protein [Actinomycetota bacterium]
MRTHALFQRAETVVLATTSVEGVTMQIFDFQGSDEQKHLTGKLLARGNYPWDSLTPGLKSQTGREKIPIEWADLSQYAESRSRDDEHMHNHSEGEFDYLEARGRILGLAWYSGKISLEASLQSNFELAGEVLWAEGCHMVDFFLLTDNEREKIYNLMHTGNPDIAPEPHGHGWFDVGTYREFVGEALMGAFVRAFSTFPDTIPFAHALADDKLPILRGLMLPKALGKGAYPYFGALRGTTFHDRHYGIRKDIAWWTREEAIGAGRKPCRVCKP